MTDEKKAPAQIEVQRAQFVIDVARAIAGVKSGNSSYGEFYVSEVCFAYEGDDTGDRVLPDEFGGYGVEFGT